MAVIDVAGFVADLKDHAVDHGFHVHDERHFVETYSLRQAWEVDLHPEEGCGVPVDLNLVDMPKLAVLLVNHRKIRPAHRQMFTRVSPKKLSQTSEQTNFPRFTSQINAAQHCNIKGLLASRIQ